MTEEAAHAGGRIVFLRYRGHQQVSIWSVRPDGSEAGELWADPALRLNDPSLCADGRHLVAIGHRVPARTAGDVFGQIFLLDLETFELDQVSDDESVKLRPAWSPDHDEIVFERSGSHGYHLFAIRTDGTHPRQITGPAVDLGEFALPSTRPASELRPYMLAQPEYEARFGPQGPVEEMPACSPDGSTIAFVRIVQHTNGEHTHDIWLVGADGADPRPLTSGPSMDLSPAWSPDGSEIAFIRAERVRPAGHREPETLLCCVEVATGTTRQVLASSGDLDEPCFSPDGTQIVFRRSDGGSKIVVVARSGGEVTAITYPGQDEHDYHPTWA